MSGEFRIRLARAVVLGMLFALFVVSPAYADPVKQLQVTVDPAVAVDDTATDFTVTVTNLASNNNPLGAVEVTVPFPINTVSGASAPTGKAWTSSWPVAGLSTEKVRLSADTLSDRLSPGQSVSVVINATTPDINVDVNDVDQVYNWFAEGRQANSFNDQMGGNEFTQALANRQGTFVFRDGSGLTSTSLGTHQTLVRSGEATDCSKGPCTASDTQSQTTVTITASACDTGTLVVDASNLFENQVGAAAFYDYFGGCPEGTIVVVDIAYARSLVNNTKTLTYIAVYEKDISDLDPNYVGDGVPLPWCDKNVSVNCVVKSETTGTNAQLKMLLTDPAVGAFR